MSNKIIKSISIMAIYLSLVFCIQFAAAHIVKSEDTLERIQFAQRLVDIVNSNAHLLTPEQREKLLRSNGVCDDWQTVGMHD